MEREIVQGSLNEVTQRLWEGSLTYCVQPIDAIPSSILALNCQGASVIISGAWQGSVLLQMTPALAFDVACVMFDCERPCSTPESRPSVAMINDCLKELANITAGNLKTALPEPCSLAIPAPHSFKDWNEIQCFGLVFTQLSFKCEKSPLDDAYFRISLIKSSLSSDHSFDT